MLCAYPWHHKKHGPLPCGQCMNCRVNKQRAWTARILLEWLVQPQAVFVTLTYSDDKLPLTVEAVPTLRANDLAKCWKRLRRSGAALRYFACGEYGNQTQRPHYHAVIFGLGPEHEGFINERWDQGFVQVADLVPARAAYCAQYTLKKMTKLDDDRLGGREPEFMRVSRNPPLGKDALPEIARVIQRYQDGGREVRIGGKRYPLDRTMVAKLEALGAQLPPGSVAREGQPDQEAYLHARQRESKNRAQAKRGAL